MAYDLLIDNATIIDGTGAPRRGGAVAIENGIIQAVGEASGAARRTIDARGSVVAPGFIDPHTHMDVFLRKYPAGLPVVNYGVTTVTIANCGASCAPLPPVGPARDILLAYLHRVLDKYVDPAQFAWTTFEDYLDALEGSVGINVGAFVPHSPVRLSVMGEAALQREATGDEMAAMLALAERGWQAGAIGFSTSPRGGPLLHSDTPSTFAARAEILALAHATAQHGGLVQYNGYVRLGEPDSDLNWYVTHTPTRMIANEWAQGPDDDESGRQGCELFAQLNAAGHPIYGVVVPYQHIRNFSGRNFYPLEGVAAWDALPKEPAALAERLADPDLRATLRAAAAERAVLARWDELLVKRTVRAGERDWEGQSVGALAAARGVAPVDVALDLLQADDGSTRFALLGARNHSLEILGEMITSPYSIIGTDAGAHLDLFYWYGAPVRLLGYWVRERGLLSLEQAVHKLTAFNAEKLGLRRGVLAPGRPADVVMFDPDTVDDALLPRLPYLVDDAEVHRVPPGIELVVVNGEVVAERGEHSGARPGKVRRWEL